MYIYKDNSCYTVTLLQLLYQCIYIKIIVVTLLQLLYQCIYTDNSCYTVTLLHLLYQCIYMQKVAVTLLRCYINVCIYIYIYIKLLHCYSYLSMYNNSCYIVAAIISIPIFSYIVNIRTRKATRYHMSIYEVKL